MSLEQSSPDSIRGDSRSILEGQMRECFGRAAYSHKTHQKCADILLSRLAFIKLTQIVLSALTTTSFFVILFGNSFWGAIVGVLVSTILLVINAYTKNYDLGELAERHKQAANDLWLIRERYLSLLSDIRIKKDSIEALIGKRDSILNDLHSVYSGSPATNAKGYHQAQKALQYSEELTFSDEEIDALLPQELKRTNNGSLRDP